MRENFDGELQLAERENLIPLRANQSDSSEADFFLEKLENLTNTTRQGSQILCLSDYIDTHISMKLFVAGFSASGNCHKPFTSRDLDLLNRKNSKKI